MKSIHRNTSLSRTRGKEEIQVLEKLIIYDTKIGEREDVIYVD